jgi:hypothetical protein
VCFAASTPTLFDEAEKDGPPDIKADPPFDFAQGRLFGDDNKKGNDNSNNKFNYNSRFLRCAAE